MEKESVKERIYGVDLVRILATILVLTVHFFLRTSYYSTPTTGISMRVQSIIRNFCMSCVPLFLIISGFLNKNKKYDKKFAKGLFQIIIVWFFYSLIEFIAFTIYEHREVDILLFIEEIFTFKYAYSWYIKMYIVLYFIMPIINIAFESFDSKSKKVLLISSILFMFGPNFICILFNNKSIIPNYWVSIYPITYYIIGKYIYEYKPKFNKRNLFLLLILNMIITYLFQFNGVVDYYNIFICIQSVIIFLIIYDFKLKNNFIKKVTKYISSITLDIYLSSSLIDFCVYKFYYSIFNLDLLNQSRVILFAPLILITSFILCFIYASFRKLIIKVR